MATTPAQNKQAGAGLALTQAGLQIGQALISASVQRGAARDRQRVGEAQAAASGVVRDAQNIAAAAESNLSRFLQTRQNQRRLDAAGRAQAGAQAAILRTEEARSGATINRRLAASEALGAQAARTAFAGITGGAESTISSTLALRDMRVQEQEDRVGAQQDELSIQRAGDLGRAGIEGMDNRAVFAPVDFRQDFSPAMAPQGNFLTDLLSIKPETLLNFGNAVADLVPAKGQPFVVTPYADSIRKP